MNLKTLSWFLWPLVVIGIIGIWWSVSERSTESAGQRIYLQHCSNCHMERGQGLRGLVPPLAKADYLQNLSLSELTCIIRYGQTDTIRVNGRVYERPMPGNELLTAVELSALVNFVRMEWGGATQKESHQSIIDTLEKCEID
ncbi:MAG: cytochrome c [Bacteroidota bacterium]